MVLSSAVRPWVWPNLVYHQRVGWSTLFTFASCSIFISSWPSFFGYNIAITKTNWKTSCRQYGNGYNLSHFHISGSSVVHLPICNCHHKKATKCKDWCFSDICVFRGLIQDPTMSHLCNILNSIDIGQIYSKQLLIPSFFLLIILSFFSLSFWLLPCPSASHCGTPFSALG